MELLEDWDLLLEVVDLLEKSDMQEKVMVESGGGSDGPTRVGVGIKNWMETIISTNLVSSHLQSYSK